MAGSSRPHGDKPVGFRDPSTVPVDLDFEAMNRIDPSKTYTDLEPGQEIGRFRASLVDARVRKNGVPIITLASEIEDKLEMMKITDYPGMMLEIRVVRHDFESWNYGVA